MDQKDMKVDGDEQCLTSKRWPVTESLFQEKKEAGDSLVLRIA